MEGEGRGVLSSARSALRCRLSPSSRSLSPCARAAVDIAAASVAARAGRCGASRCPLLAVALALAICLLSGALQRPLPSAAAAVTAALQRPLPVIARYGLAASLTARCVSLHASVVSATLSVVSPARRLARLAVSRSRRPLPRPARHPRAQPLLRAVNDPLAVLRRALLHLPGRRRQWGWCSLPASSINSTRNRGHDITRHRTLTEVRALEPRAWMEDTKADS